MIYISPLRRIRKILRIQLFPQTSLNRYGWKLLNSGGCGNSGLGLYGNFSISTQVHFHILLGDLIYNFRRRCRSEKIRKMCSHRKIDSPPVSYSAGMRKFFLGRDPGRWESGCIADFRLKHRI
jgi:hypothetical protein